jgi:hypothetical protein
MANPLAEPQASQRRASYEAPASETKTEVRDLAWRCPSCDNILGYVSKNAQVLRMKYKDFYVFIEEAHSVVTLCRRCGRECVLSQASE